MRSGNVILAAGGTGGHIFPAEALAEALLARGYQPVLVTDPRFHQYHSAGDGVLSHIPIHTIRAASMRGGVLTLLRHAWTNLLGVYDARRILASLKPLAVVGFGGYPSFPTMLAAIRMHYPTLVHEQNAVLGRVNRVLAHKLNAIAASTLPLRRLPASLESRVVLTGNPVRAAVCAVNQKPYPALGDHDALQLLVTGGSQGASVFGDVIPAAMAQLPIALQQRIHITQQCRAQELEQVRRAYSTLSMRAEVAPFFTDMAARLMKAHLVIGRAGASTVAELLVSGRPGVCVPLPTAADNHQYYNALALESAGAGWLVPQEAFTPDMLARLLESLLQNPDALVTRAAAARQHAMPDAAEKLADIVLKIAGLNPSSPAKEAS